MTSIPDDQQAENVLLSLDPNVSVQVSLAEFEVLRIQAVAALAAQPIDTATELALRDLSPLGR